MLCHINPTFIKKNTNIIKETIHFPSIVHPFSFFVFFLFPPSSHPHTHLSLIKNSLQIIDSLLLAFVFVFVFASDLILKKDKKKGMRRGGGKQWNRIYVKTWCKSVNKNYYFSFSFVEAWIAVNCILGFYFVLFTFLFLWGERWWGEGSDARGFILFGNQRKYLSIKLNFSFFFTLFLIQCYNLKWSMYYLDVS